MTWDPEDGREDAAGAISDGARPDEEAAPSLPPGDGWDRREFLGVSLGALPVVGWAAAGVRAIRRPAIEPGSGFFPIPVTLHVNGSEKQVLLDPRVSLLEALREDLGLSGTKEGCDHGQCGACTVLVDGRRVLSCLTLAVAAGGRAVTTIEGLAKGDELHPVQQAFLDHDGFQCGYCTPGQIVSAVGLLGEGCPSDPAAIRECMSGNICRCGAYPNIVAAVLAARGAGQGGRS